MAYNPYTRLYPCYHGIMARPYHHAVYRWHWFHHGLGCLCPFYLLGYFVRPRAFEIRYRDIRYDGYCMKH